MRNKFPGRCYRCGEWVPAGAGHFERVPGKGWQVQSAACAIKYRGTEVGRSQPQAEPASREVPDAPR